MRQYMASLWMTFLFDPGHLVVPPTGRPWTSADVCRETPRPLMGFA